MVKEPKIPVWINLVKSFMPGNDGFMARKLTAFAFMCLIAYCTKKYVNSDNVIDAIMVFCLMVLLLLAVITADDLIKYYLKLKNEKQSSGNFNSGINGNDNPNVLVDQPACGQTCPECGQHLQK